MIPTVPKMSPTPMIATAVVHSRSGSSRSRTSRKPTVVRVIAAM